MGLDGASDLPDDGDGGGAAGKGTVSCSICLDAVSDNGDRSWAKLQCGHRFHLDCIGSAFNVKGAMQCPNCRKIEKGQWLYANNCRPFHDFTMDDWARDEDLYDLSFSEMTFGVHWCPFNGVTRVPSVFDDGEFSSTAYHDLLGQHAIFPDHSAVSSGSHPCPYITYFGPVHPSSSNSNGSVPDGPSFSNHWNAPSMPSDAPTSYTFPSMDLHYHSWEHHSAPFSTTSSNRITGTDQPSIPSITQRLLRANSDIQRSGTYVHPFVVGQHNLGARAGASVSPSVIPPYPGSNARSRDRIQSLQAYYQQQQPSNSAAMHASMISGTRRSSGHRSTMAQPAPVAPVASSSDQTGSFYFFPPSGANFQEPETPISTRFPFWGRDRSPSFPLNRIDGESVWGPFHQAGNGSDPILRPSIFRQRQGSDRTSHNRS